MPTAADPAVWDAHASRYRHQEHLERRAVEAALRLCAPGEQDTLVDLGTGTGLVLRTLAGRDPRPACVVGVDRSAGMLARLGDLPAGWSTLEADARHVPLPDGAADVVTISYVLHLLPPPDRAAVLREAGRLLRPGGAFAAVTVWTGTRPAACALGAALGAMARARPAAWGGLRPHDPTADLQAAGMVVTRRVQLPRGGYPSLVVLARKAAS